MGNSTSRTSQWLLPLLISITATTKKDIQCIFVPFKKASRDLKAVTNTMTTTTFRSVVCICSAPTDDVTKVCVILASHPLSPLLPLFFHPSLSPPLCWSLARSLSLNFLVFLYLISYPDSSCLSSLSLSFSLSSLSFSVSLSSSKSPSRLVLAQLAAPPPSSIPLLFLLSVALPRSVWLSSVIKHRRSDTDRMWGQTRRGSERAWVAHKQKREEVRDSEDIGVCVCVCVCVCVELHRDEIQFLFQPSASTFCGCSLY